MSSLPHRPPTTGPRWWIVLILGLLTVVCGTIGFYEYGMAHAEPDGPSDWLIGDAIYQGFQLLVLHTLEFPDKTNAWIEAGQWLGVFTFLTTTWMLLWRRLRQELRLVALGFWNHHYVFCGLSPKGLAIMESIRERNPRARIVAIDAEPEPELEERCHQLRICLIRQDAAEHRGLKTARVAQAREILAVNGDDEVNIRLAAEVREYRKGLQAPPAHCRAHISNSHLPAALQKWTDASADPHTTLRFFDVFDSEARRVLLAAPLEGAANDERIGHMAPLDGPGLGAGDGRSVHVVILGLGRMGGALLVRAAKMGHFANGKKLRVSVIDRDAQAQREQLLFRYPVLADPHNEVCDLQAHQWLADSLDARQFIERCAAEPDTILHLFVCLDSNARAVEIGLRLWEMVAHHPHGYVHVRITSRASVAPILQAAGARIQPFGMLEDTCTEETVLGERIEALARAIHEDFVAARRGDAGRGADPALADWDRLREDFRESNRQQADHMAIKMRAIGCRIVDAGAPGDPLTAFTPDEVEMLARLEHRRWNADRWLSGWRPGKVTDKAKRIHSSIVPWDELSQEVQGFDRETILKLPHWLAGARPALKVVRA